MKIQDDWLFDERTQLVLNALLSAGYQAYFVGGCVRNALLNEPVNDIDISTDAPPKVTQEIMEKAGIRAIPTGIEHGTITALVEKLPHEITTFRKDVSTDGRRAVVAFTDDIREDAVRRDFTINALYADKAGKVIDPLGGLADITPPTIRFIEDANLRIKEDYLRILRFFRFYAWYGEEGNIDAEGFAACAENLDGLGSISKERIGSELIKLLTAENPAPAMASMSVCGVLMQILPGASVESLPVLVHLEGTRAPSAIRRLALIGGENPKDQLRLSKADNAKLEATRNAALSDQKIALTAYTHGAEVAEDALLVRCALMATDLPSGYEKEIAKGVVATFPIKAIDLPDFQGKFLGEKLNELRAKWIASDFQMTKTELLS